MIVSLVARLHSTISTNLGFDHLRPDRSEEVAETLVSSWQCQSSDGEDDQQDEGEGGSHIDNLPCHLDTLPDGKVDHDPGGHQGSEQLPAEGAHVLNTLGHVEHSPVIELLSAGVSVASQALVGVTCGIVTDDGAALVTVPPMVTGLPGQGALEGGDEIEDGPGHDDIVVGGQQPRHYDCRQSSTF